MGAKEPPSKQGEKIVCVNRKARHDYFLSEAYEGGLVLTGSEVKSLRDGKANLTDSYAAIERGELFLVNSYIAEYPNATYNNHTPLRARKILVHRQELHRLARDVAEKGFSLIPTALYFKDGRAKVEFFLAKGKKQFDKREATAKREAERNVRRALRR
ncbi:MAG: SsrA-binding protein SmpB [Deltaproteobacteria bacterium]|nr:SsrA-binding protein SmpB [Deltaproteobacteria bacterium]